MGADVESRNFTRQGRQQYRAKVRRCLDVFALMLAEAKFDFERPLTGLEIELNLIDAEQDPAMRNADVLALIANNDLHTESCRGGPGWRTSSDLGLILLGRGRPGHGILAVIASQRQDRDADVGAVGWQFAAKDQAELLPLEVPPRVLERVERELDDTMRRR